jgi:hypothetical protein
MLGCKKKVIANIVITGKGMAKKKIVGKIINILSYRRNPLLYIFPFFNDVEIVSQMVMQTINHNHFQYRIIHQRINIDYYIQLMITFLYHP